MYKILIIPLTLISFTSISQITWNCYTEDEYGNTVKIDCDGHIPTPIFTGNIDSLCWEMEKRFVNTLNEWRRNHGLKELKYDYDMKSLLTVPWNESQVQKGGISHGEGSTSLENRSNRVGIRGVGECAAYNSRSDVGDISQFFNQYRNSAPHWRILTDPRMNFISVSVLYDQEKNTYYSTVNVRW